MTLFTQQSVPRSYRVLDFFLCLVFEAFQVSGKSCLALTAPEHMSRARQIAFFVTSVIRRCAVNSTSYSRTLERSTSPCSRVCPLAGQASGSHTWDCPRRPTCPHRSDQLPVIWLQMLPFVLKTPNQFTTNASSEAVACTREPHSSA